MSIRIGEVLTWGNWDLPPDLSEASKKDYPSQKEALEVLEKARKWLVTHAPENANKIHLLINAKKGHLRSDYLRSNDFPNPYPDWIFSKDELVKEAYDSLHHNFSYPSLFFLGVKVEAMIKGNNDQNLLIPILEKIAADPKAVRAIESMEIPLPQKITSENWSLFLYLMRGKIRYQEWARSHDSPENDPASKALKKRAIKAWRTVLSDMIPQEWIEKFKSTLQNSLIKERLSKEKLEFPDITRKNCIKIYETLVSECKRRKDDSLEITRKVIDDEMKPVCEKILADMEKQEHPVEFARKKQRVSEDKTE